MKKSNQFWKDVDLAICALMLRELLNQIIIEGRKSRQSLWEINKAVLKNSGRDHVLYHYHEVMMTRFRKHPGHLFA